MKPWLLLVCGCAVSSTPAGSPPPLDDLSAARDLSVAPAPDLSTAPDLSPGMTMHSILPSLTDPAIGAPDDPHLTWSSGAGNGRLLVFFPGSGAKPSQYTDFFELAASTGYHVIGLDYPNQFGSMSQICGTDTACYWQVRNELWTGQDTSPKVAVDANNCILHRLQMLLAHLTSHYPSEGWDIFYDRGAIAWNKMTAAGHSQGGGHAAFAAATYRVARVVMFSSVSDASNATSPPTPADWLKAPHATPSDRYFGLDHVDDTAYHDKILVDWPLLGMTGALTDVDVELPPYGKSHQLIASRPLASPHNQVIANSTPEVGGVSVYEDAWRYLIGP
jgi:pimeloyl-ACP methyl ester carboxylesterase